MTAPNEDAVLSPPTNRLTRRQDVLSVLQEGQRARHNLLMVAFRPNGLPRNRFAYAIGKRVGNAVVRNLVRRRLREIVRAAPLRPGYDIVVSGRPPAAEASFDELRRAFVSCAYRGRITRDENGA